MWQLAGFLATALVVTVAVAWWSWRPSLSQRQGEQVAKTRGRFGLGERMGWLRRQDLDAEMWPAEEFGGVSDEQFWDDMSSDKPLATTARTATQHESVPYATAPYATAQQDSDERRRPAPVSSARPATTSATTQAMPAATQGIPATTQAMPAIQPNPVPPSRPSPSAPQPVAAQPAAAMAQHYQTRPAMPRSATQPQPLAATSGPLPMATGPQPTGPQPTGTGPQRTRRHRGADEDPLTSPAFSLRASRDGRSYQSSRREGESTGPYPAAQQPQYPAAHSPAAHSQAAQYPATYSQPAQYPAAQYPTGPQPARPAADYDEYGRPAPYPYPASQYSGSSSTPPAGARYGDYSRKPAPGSRDSRRPAAPAPSGRYQGQHQGQSAPRPYEYGDYEPRSGRYR